MKKRELEMWLCGPDAPILTPAEIADLLGVSLEAIGDTTLLRVMDRLRGVRFTLAVLRDVFTDDADVRRWLRMPRAEFGGRCALELLLAGRMRAVEDLAVREWHRPSIGRGVRRRPGSLVLASDGQLPAALDRHEAEPEAENRANDRHRGGGELQHAADHDHGCAGEGGDGIHIAAQHRGHLRHQHVAHHAATDSGQHA